jgi:hypothetical protein
MILMGGRKRLNRIGFSLAGSPVTVKTSSMNRNRKEESASLLITDQQIAASCRTTK